MKIFLSFAKSSFEYSKNPFRIFVPPKNPYRMVVRQKNPFRIIVKRKKSFLSCGQRKNIFEEPEKRRKKGGEQVPSRPCVKQYEKDFFSEKCPKQPEKAKKYAKKERRQTLLFRMSEWCTFRDSNPGPND